MNVKVHGRRAVTMNDHPAEKTVDERHQHLRLYVGGDNTQSRGKVQSARARERAVVQSTKRAGGGASAAHERIARKRTEREDT